VDPDVRADVVIIGAGVMGCSLAFYLSRAGRRVIVIDRGRIGQGATAACAGGIRAQFSTEINIRIGMEAKRILARFSQETGQTADFRPVGYLFLLTTEAEQSRFHDAVRLQRSCGLDDVVELSPAQAQELVPGLQTGDLSGATFCPSDGLAGPNEVTFGFANAARRRGALIMEETPLEAFVTAGTTVTGVRTAAGAIECAQTVICAGPWSADVGAMLGLRLPIEPSRRQIFVTEPFSGIRRSSPMTIDFHTSFYFHPEGDGVLFGMSDPATPPGDDTRVDWSFLDRITAVAQRRWPPLLDARVKTAWAGLYENTPDSQPLIGPLQPGLWIAGGFSGHGFMMAPAVGRWLADWIAAGAPPVDLTAFAPDRFATGAAIEPERNVV
jgi:glycine/D-amino acid oxidase-like deaminating enzyme